MTLRTWVAGRLFDLAFTMEEAMNKVLRTISAAAVGATLFASAGVAQDMKMLTAWGGNHSGTANMAYGYIAFENGGARLVHGSGGMIRLRAA